MVVDVMNAKRYQKKPDRPITAVQLTLDCEGFGYHKWGAEQKCQRNDWLANNDGDCYTIAADSFAKTYREVSPGRYVKVSIVWAYQAQSAGSVNTSEGQTLYVAGDYVVSNEEDGSDSYAVARQIFEQMYEEVVDE